MRCTKKFLCWLTFALIFMTVISEGCNDSPKQYDNDKAASNTNNVDQYQDQYSTDTDNEYKYNFSQLTGTWLASKGSGTGTGSTGNYSFIVTDMSITLGDFDNAGTTIFSSTATWDIYENGIYITSLVLKNDKEKIKLIQTGNNVWESDDGDVIITLTSATTAIVKDSGTIDVDDIDYYYTGEYTLTKINDGNNATYQNTYSLNQFAGTWIASSGSGSGTATGSTGNYTFTINCSATLGQFDSSGTTFTTLDRTWHIYQNGYYIMRLLFDTNSGSMALTNIGADTWRATFPDEDSDLPESDVIIMLTSANTAHVRESGVVLVQGEYYNYEAEYTMTKITAGLANNL